MPHFIEYSYLIKISKNNKFIKKNLLWFNNFHTMKHLMFILSLFRNLMYCFRKKALNIKRQRDTLAYIRFLGLFIHRILGIPNLDMYQVTGIIKMKPSFKKRILSPQSESHLSCKRNKKRVWMSQPS